jgi:hypothetical protein
LNINSLPSGPLVTAVSFTNTEALMWQYSFYSVEIFHQTFGIIPWNQIILSNYLEIVELSLAFSIAKNLSDHSFFIWFVCLDSQHKSCHFPRQWNNFENTSELLSFISIRNYVCLYLMFDIFFCETHNWEMNVGVTRRLYFFWDVMHYLSE